MKQNSGYMLKRIAGVPYVLPFGQNVADHRRGVALNETGVILWNALAQEISVEGLLEQFLEKIAFEGTEQEKTEITGDVHNFLKQLVNFGIVVENCGNKEVQTWQYVEIGGVVVELAGPAEVFSEEFAPFVMRGERELRTERECKENHKVHTDLTIQVHFGRPQSRENGSLLLRNQELVICEREQDYLLLFPQSQQIVEAAVFKKGDYAEFYCLGSCSEKLQYDMFHAIRLVYLYHVQKRGMYALHSASILYEGKAWLFSGPSGTGKSTHTNLWKEIFQTPLINGDLNLLAMNGSEPVIHGMPWCGTSEICDTKTYPLGGIILLKQHPENRIVELPEDKKALYVMQRMISPAWTQGMVEQNTAFAEALIKNVYVARLLCTKENDAAVVMKRKIDEVLEEGYEKSFDV